MIKIFTIGYEGASSDQVFRALKEAGANSLIDVRADAGRRKEFQRDRLQVTADGEGLFYFYYPTLGIPRSRRTAIRKGIWPLERVYESILVSDDGLTFLTRHADAIKAGLTFCLMCYERDANGCHRKLLAEALQKLVPGSEVVHLVPAEI